MIRAAIDSGSHRVSLVIADGDASPVRVLYRHTYAVGTWEDLPEPIERVWIRKRDGQEMRRTITKKHVVTDADIRLLGDVLALKCLEYGAQRAILERVDKVHFSETTTTAGKAGQATATLIAERILERVDMRLTDREIEIRKVIAVSARAVVAGKASATDAEIRASVLPHLIGFEEAGREPITKDDVDAGCALLWDFLPRTPRHRKRTPRKPGATVTPRGPRKPRDESPKGREIRLKKRRARARALRLAKRERAGCTCGLRRGRHRMPCPIAVARWERWMKPVENYVPVCPPQRGHAYKVRAMMMGKVRRWPP